MVECHSKIHTRTTLMGLLKKKTAKEGAGKKTFRLSHMALDAIEEIKTSLKKDTTKEVLEIIIRDSLSSKQFFNLIMSKKKEHEPIMPALASRIGGLENFWKNYKDIDSGVRPVIGKTFAMTQRTASSLESLQNCFKLNQSKTLELLILTFKVRMDLDTYKQRPINKSINKLMENFVLHVEETECALEKCVQELLDTEVSQFFKDRVSQEKEIQQAIKSSKDQDDIFYDIDSLEIYDDEILGREGLSGLEKALLNFMVLRNLAKGILQDCRTNLSILEETIENKQNEISGNSEQQV